MNDLFPVRYVTRYMGSKYPLLEQICPRILKLVGTREPTLVDLMAGTHAIGVAMQPHLRVVANDIQEYSAVIGRLLLIHEMTSDSLRSHVQRFRESYSRFSYNSDHWFVEKYQESYFSKSQCEEIAAIREHIETVSESGAHDLLLVALMHAMGKCQSSPGHFAQYMPSTHPRIEKLRGMSIFLEMDNWLSGFEPLARAAQNTVLTLNYSDFFKSETWAELPTSSVVYLDPPYSSAQYSRYYHLLETLVKWDDPEIFFKGLYRNDRHQSPFGSERKAVSAFNDIAACTAAKNGSSLVISYSNTGLVPIEEIEDIAGNYYSNVQTFSIQHRHSMQGRGVDSSITELLIVASNR